MANSYVRGQLVRVSARFQDSASVDVDPTAVVCRVKAPGGAVTTPTVVKDSVGDYHADVDANVEGRWHYRFEGTGAYQGAGETHFDVAEGPFA